MRLDFRVRGPGNDGDETLLKRFRIDPYLIALAATVLIAWILPVSGIGATIAGWVTAAAIFLLFFLHGAKLAPKAVLDGIAHWRLQLFILLSTFALFPVLGLGLRWVVGGNVAPELMTGVLFVCLLPSTVQSSIAFTSIARGNVPAAICAASVSNLAGIVLTPLLVGLILHTQGGVSLSTVRDVALQLLLPFALGQLARPYIGAFLKRHGGVTSYVDRGSILLVVYGAFSAGVTSGVFHGVDATDIAWVLGLDALLLAVVLVATTLGSRWLGLPTEDEIAIVFCGSKKSLASGIPMANILFPVQTVGLVVLPLMLFHQIQLFACAFLAQRYAARGETREESATVSAV